MNVRGATTLLLAIFVAIALSSCIHPMVRIHKAALLDPTMDPAKTEGMYRSLLAEPQQWLEHGSTDGGGAVGASCPTCGG